MNQFDPWTSKNHTRVLRSTIRLTRKALPSKAFAATRNTEYWESEIQELSSSRSEKWKQTTQDKVQSSVDDQRLQIQLGGPSVGFKQTLAHDVHEDESQNKEGKEVAGPISADGVGGNLPFPDPCPVTCDEPPKVVYYNIYQMNLTALQNLCHKYNIKPGGRKKQAYIEILQEFSRRKSVLSTLIPNHRPHKGPHMRGKRKLESGSPRKPKLSTIRWQQLRVTQNLTLVTESEAMEFRKQNDLLQWATRTVTSLYSKGDRDVPHWKNTREPESSSAHYSTVPTLEKVPETISNGMRCHTINLQSGMVRFTEADVPEPPCGIGLNIEKLVAIWDDSWPSWKNLSPLVIKGQSIPLKYLRHIYIGSSQWKHLKRSWSKWNFLMREYESLGPYGFWEKWSLHGKRTPSEILKVLAEERKKKEKEGAMAAKDAHPEDFPQMFSYRKGGQTIKLASEKGIARRFWQLNQQKA